MRRAIGVTDFPLSLYKEDRGDFQRAYIDTTKNGSEFFGRILAAAIVPIPLTAISSRDIPYPPIGETCLNHLNLYTV